MSIVGFRYCRTSPARQVRRWASALYRRPRDGAVFAIVAPKEGPREGYLWQYRLTDAGGRIAAQFVRRFGTFSAGTVREENEIEAVAVDDELGIRVLRG